MKSPARVGELSHICAPSSALAILAISPSECLMINWPCFARSLRDVAFIYSATRSTSWGGLESAALSFNSEGDGGSAVPTGLVVLSFADPAMSGWARIGSSRWDEVGANRIRVLSGKRLGQVASAAWSVEWMPGNGAHPRNPKARSNRSRMMRVVRRMSTNTASPFKDYTLHTYGGCGVAPEPGCYARSCARKSMTIFQRESDAEAFRSPPLESGAEAPGSPRMEREWLFNSSVSSAVKMTAAAGGDGSRVVAVSCRCTCLPRSSAVCTRTSRRRAFPGGIRRSAAPRPPRRR